MVSIMVNEDKLTVIILAFTQNIYNNRFVIVASPATNKLHGWSYLSLNLGYVMMLPLGRV